MKKEMIKCDLIDDIMSEEFCNFLRKFSGPYEKINGVWYLPVFFINEFKRTKDEV